MAMRALGFNMRKKDVIPLMPHKNGTQERPQCEQDCGYIEFEYFQELMRHKFASQYPDPEKQMQEAFTMFAEAKKAESNSIYQVEA